MLRSREKCLAVAEELLVSGRSAVVGKFSCSRQTVALADADIRQTTPIAIAKLELTGSALRPDSTCPSGENQVGEISRSMSKADSSSRLFHFLCPIELAKHNNMYRACYASPDEPVRELLPGSAFSGYVGQFEAPTLGEGFDQIRGVNFVFEGDDVQRRKWDMWMLEATW